MQDFLLIYNRQENSGESSIVIFWVLNIPVPVYQIFFKYCHWMNWEFVSKDIFSPLEEWNIWDTLWQLKHVKRSQNKWHIWADEKNPSSKTNEVFIKTKEPNTLHQLFLSCLQISLDRKVHDICISISHCILFKLTKRLLWYFFPLIF